MWNDPAVKGSLQSDPIQERCAHMSGLRLRPTAAGLDDVRDRTGQSNQRACLNSIHPVAFALVALADLIAFLEATKIAVDR